MTTEKLIDLLLDIASEARRSALLIKDNPTHEQVESRVNAELNTIKRAYEYIVRSNKDY